LKVKGKTQGCPLAGPLEATQAGVAVVVVVVVVVVAGVVVEVVVVVVEVVPEVVPLQSRVVQTAMPWELQTQVLQSIVKVLPGVQEVEPEPEPEPEPELPSTGQEAGQVPSEPGTCSPPAVILVLHQGPAWSTVVHSVYTTPL